MLNGVWIHVGPNVKFKFCRKKWREGKDDVPQNMTLQVLVTAVMWARFYDV
jgi:hypothetical protein